VLNIVAVLVVVIGVLCVLNTVLTLGMARRLRTQNELLANPSGFMPGNHFPPVMRVAGEQTSAFSTTTVDGAPVDETFFDETSTLVAAFSIGCPACEERFPEFLQFAAAFPGGRERVLALVIGAEGTEEKAELLKPVATVVVEDTHGGPLCTSLGTKAYPALGIIEPGGGVRASGTLIQDVAIALEKV
jgi:hypothetical protein